MDRRSALKYLGIASAAAVMLPSCIQDEKKLSIALNNLKISGHEEELVAAIASSLIPLTDTPGAKEVDAHLFTFVMIDDCHPKEEQEKFLSGMRAFDDDVKKLVGKSFMKSSAEERMAILEKLQDEKAALTDDARIFYEMTKRYIIQGYLSSKHFLTNVKPYQHVPGPVFLGCKSFSNDQNDLS
jgi:hypothetical protein